MKSFADAMLRGEIMLQVSCVVNVLPVVDGWLDVVYLEIILRLDPQRIHWVFYQIGELKMREIDSPRCQSHLF
jgi:hypothetical protein